MKSRRRTAAFTMVELLVALAVAVIVTGAVYALYTNYVKAFIAQDRVIETQQTARIAIDTLTQDLIRAGYKVASTDPAITFAANGVVEMVLYNEQATEYERIRYYLDGSNNLVREVWRQSGGTWPGTKVQANSGVLAEEVRFQDLNGNGALDAGEAPALEFAYYTQSAFETNPTSPAALDVSTPKDADTVPETGSASDPTSLRGIRQVKVVLTVRSPQKDPVTGGYVYRTLRADVKPRNAGLMATIKDSTPPATPTGLASADRGDCGYLYLSWNANTEPDIAGYVIYYRTSATAAGVYLNSINVNAAGSHSAGAPYALSGLVDGTQYFLAISAFDYSGNSSPISAEVTTGAGNDATPNVADPDAAPAAFNGVAGLNTVTLSWDKVAESDISGYRIYRKPSAFGATDFDAIRAGNLAGAGIREVANETSTLTATATGWSFADGTADLKGCTAYYYAVTAIKGCGHPITGYPNTLFATTGPRAPSDTTKPDPVAMKAYPSYLRNYLSLTSPTHVDFTHARVAYRTDGVYPGFSVDGSGAIVTDGTLVQCQSTSYGEGTFTETGAVPTFLHRGVPCDTGYHLNPSVTYYYTAVAVDTCKNLSNYATTSSQVAATQCADETEGLGVGNPPRVAGLNGNTKPMAGNDLQSEAPLAWTAIDDSFTGVRDLAGYYVARKTGDSAGATGAVVLSDVWTDSKAPGLRLGPDVLYTGLTEGKVDRVRILAVDCETVTKDDAAHTFLSSRYAAAEFDLKASDTIIFYPGRPRHDSAIATRTLGKTQNVVEFQMKNTINADATPSGAPPVRLKTLTFSAVNPADGLVATDRLLKSVTLNNGVTTVKRTFADPGLALPATFDAVDDTAARMGFRGAKNATFQLEFYNATNKSASSADMRKLRIDATVTYVPVVRINTDTAAPEADGTREATVSFSVPAAKGPDITNVGQRIAGSGSSFTAASTTVGATGAAVQFDAFDIEVKADVFDNSGKGISRVSLHYAMTAKTVTSAPVFDTGFPFPVGVSYATVTICDSDTATTAPDCTGSSTYFGRIPVQADLRVWSLLRAEDKTGNYSVSPAQETTESNVTYVYDQAGGLL